MIVFLSIQCIYKGRKTGKKTNRCQKINVQKSCKIYLYTENYLITYLTYPKQKQLTRELNVENNFWFWNERQNQKKTGQYISSENFKKDAR